MNPSNLCRGEQTVVPGVLRGYRTWRLNQIGQLLSTGGEYVWSASNSAVCGVAALAIEGCLCGNPRCDVMGTLMEGVGSKHQAPGQTCYCGFYGWYRPDDVRIVTAPVIGCIEVQGVVNLGTHGFRAERARILGLVTPKHVPEVWNDLTEAGVKLFPDLSTLVQALPPDDVRELVDHPTCGPECKTGDRLTAAVNVRFGSPAAYTVQAWVAATAPPSSPSPAVGLPPEDR